MCLILSSVACCLLLIAYLWGKVQDKKKYIKKHMHKRTNIIFVPSKRYQDSRIILQSLKVLKIVMGFIIHSQGFTEPNYPDVDISFGLFCVVPETK